MVLNEYLYRRLCDRFGDVRVEKRGEAAQFSASSTLLSPNNEVPKARFAYRGETYRVDCPFCSDQRKRLYVNHWWGRHNPETRQNHWGAVVCFNEDCLSLHHPNGEENLEQLRHWIYGDVLSGRLIRCGVAQGVKKGAPPKIHKPKMPGYCIAVDELPNDHPAVRYLEQERGFDPKKIAERYGVSFCVSTESRLYRRAVGRLILPVFVDKKFRGWQARFIGKPPEKSPKYWTCPGMSISTSIYSYDLMKTFHEIVLVEGPMSAWGFGPEAGGLLGKRVLSGQMELLQKIQPRVIYLALDPDRTKDAVQHHMEVAEQSLSTWHHKVCPVWLPPGQDPGTVPRTQQLKLCRAAARKVGIEPWIGTLQNRRTV